MEQERITFGKFTLPVIPKSNLSFRIHKDIEEVDISQKCLLDNPWNAKSDIQKLEVLNVLSFHFKQLNDKLESFSNTSSSDIHYCIPMDTDIENFICRKKTKESKATFLKSFQNEFQKESSNQNEVPKLSEES